MHIKILCELYALVPEVLRQCKNKKAVLSQDEQRDVAVNFDTYRILQQHRTCGFPATARLSRQQMGVNYLSKSDKY